MAMAPTVEPVPLREDDRGTLRVGGTRATLDTVVTVFKNGASAEEIALKFPVLKLADDYAVIAYYLRHTDEVDDYIAEGEAHADEVRRRWEAHHDPNGIRDRLLARPASNWSSVVCFAAYENVDNDILRGLSSRSPDLDVVRVQDTDIVGAIDPDVLAWAAEHGRALLSHDRRIMPD